MIYTNVGNMPEECTICTYEYQAEGDRCPKLLTCSHTVCLECLRQLVQRSPEALERNRFNNDVNRVIEGDAGRINENNDAIGDIMLRDIIIHGINTERDIDAGIREGTSEARNNEIGESTVDSQSRRDNVSDGTRARNLVNMEELHFTGFLNYIRYKFVSCKQTCKSACPVVCGIFLLLDHLFSLGLGIYIIVDLAT